MQHTRFLITFGTWLLQIWCTMASTEENTPTTDKAKYRILVLGGNGFIGSEVVSSLTGQGHKIYMMNRGSFYFDYNTRIKPHVVNVVCDRDDGIGYCDDIMAIIRSTPMFDFVIDFSGFEPRDIQDSVKVLKDKVGLYIYISTDSVYEVCAYKNHSGLIRETDAVRPHDPQLRKQFNLDDTYGDEKLGGEEVLVKQRKAGGFPYAIFRLPDVLGQRDSTNRWWIYHMWIKFNSAIRTAIPIPPSVSELRTSYVYVKDIAQAVRLVMERGPQAWDQAYNLGFDQDFTLQELLEDMAEALNKQWVRPYFSESDDVSSFFPSVTRGALDISKAQDLLGYQPTEWKQALKEITEFYEMAFHEYPRERDKVVGKVQHYVVPGPHRGEFLDAVKAAIQESKGQDDAGEHQPQQREDL